MNKQIKQLVKQAKDHADYYAMLSDGMEQEIFTEKFAELIVRECLDKIETHRIPVGNSAAGEMACEWTYDALKEVRDEIKEHFGVEE